MIMKISIYRSGPKGERLKKVKSGVFKKALSHQANQITIIPNVKYQTHLGFGGAVTEATAYTVMHDMKDKNTLKQVVNDYFTSEGLAYDLVRIHMNSSDFSLGNYTYVQDNDVELKTFDISREDKYVVPFLKLAKKANKELKILVSPWSPPGWMKTNKEMNHGGELLPQHYKTWAKYFVKFIQEMEKRRLPIWGVSVQNEPAAVQRWDSCIYSPEQERDFVKLFLGPALKHANLGHVKILVWDHNRDIIIDRVTPIYKDKKAAEFIWGTAFHWYGSEASENLSKVHYDFPDKHLLFTEGCIEGGPRPGAWDTGERYARNIINDFNHFNEGFIDWNLVLNEQGGPNHVENFCDAPILADRQKQKLIYNSSYYFIGHFSKFIRPGAVRIDHSKRLNPGLRAVTYRNPNQEIIVVIHNQSDEEQKVSLEITANFYSETIPAHAIVTLVVEPKK
jgi:glucosylceramidase